MHVFRIEEKIYRSKWRLLNSNASIFDRRKNLSIEIRIIVIDSLLATENKFRRSNKILELISMPFASISRRIFFRQTFEVSSRNVYPFRRIGKRESCTRYLEIVRLGRKFSLRFFLTIKFERTYFGQKGKFIDRSKDSCGRCTFWRRGTSFVVRIKSSRPRLTPFLSGPRSISALVVFQAFEIF